MSRSSFFSRSSRDSSPLLPQHANAVSLQDLTLSPQTPSQERTASPSPPPSFYADTRTSPSPSPSRTKTRKIQFAAPPPPIATSILLPPQKATYQTNSSSFAGSYDGGGSTGRSLSPRIKRSGAAAAGIDPLLGLERRERAIQNDLQMLLDAQSAGLVQGFGGEVPRGGGRVEGSSDAGSSTPTSRSLQRSESRGQGSGGIVPVRQPKRKIVGLRGARRGLLRDMEELVAVKREEVGILNGEIGRREVVLGKVEGWEKRIEGVRGQLSEYSGAGGAEPIEGVGDAGGEEAQEIAELRTEERAVENEILEMEDRLAQMKARKRWLGERIKESINRREARLSSYRGALREVESEVKDFLRRPPIPVSVVMGDEEGFTALPASRRTLGMAKEWWNKEVLQLKTRQEEVEKEKAALEEGAEMWASSVKVVVDFEDDLRKQMASTDVQDMDMLRRQIAKMEGVIKTLSVTLHVAEDRGWNLLICAVGAELEAFKEGEEILKGALGVTASVDTEEHGDDQSHDRNFTNGLEELNGQNQRAVSLDREDSEDDGPNLAELLVDRGDHAS
ncbi:hypothetical protein ACEPPN_005378 [Leptodophora sp. 'Broadleaf-Isolate-01']